MNSTLDPALKMKLAELESALLAAHPRMPILLKEIHTAVKNQPETVTLLSDEEIAILVRGLKQQTKTEITQAALKKKTALKNVSALDL